MELAMKILCCDETVRSNTVQDLKDSNTQSLETQSKKTEQLVSLLRAIDKAFDLMGDDVVDLSTENESLKNKIISLRWFGQSKAKLLNLFIDEKRWKWNMSRKEIVMKKPWISSLYRLRWSREVIFIIRCL